ncbi:MAG TPA: YceD family protein [Rhodanobacteraceae bacterium]
MSASLPVSVDAERMVAGRRSFAGALAVASLTRLAEALAGTLGEVRYQLDFQHSALGGLELRVRASARLTLECQRTLQPFQWPAAVDTRLGLLASEDEVVALPEGYEPLLLEHGSLQPRKVIEDELLLALPLVPVKPGSEVAQGDWNTSGAGTPDAEVVRPFADLRALLNARTGHD